MKEDLKKYFDEIEHLQYSERLPSHASLFENKAIISKFLWDIHSHNAKKFYINNNTKYDSKLEEYGYITGKLDKKNTDLLMKIFNSCEKIKFDPFDFDSDYVYEPRKNLHDDMIRINNYYKPSKFFFENLPNILNPLKQTLEQEIQFYWRVASSRIFEVKPVNKAQGFHKDDQALAIKKLFFYPKGANRKIGSTILIDKKGKETIIELESGSWLLFENSLCEHQAFSSEECVGRPTIEIDLMPDFSTDTKIEYHGINGWYPWIPMQESSMEIKGGLDYKNVYDRNLKRILGLCEINKTDTYRFPCEFSDYYKEGNYVFEEINEAEENNINIKEDIKEDINRAVEKNGLITFLIIFFKTIPNIFLKKTIKKFK